MVNNNWKGNFKNRAISDEEFKQVIQMLRDGFVTKEGRKVKSKQDVMIALFIERYVGIRVSDCCRIKRKDLVHDGNNRYRLNNVIEKKTQLVTNRKINKVVYDTIINYCNENNINNDDTIVKCSVRNVQKVLKLITDTLNIDNCSTHSCRKAYSFDIWESTKNLYSVQKALNHKSIKSTEHYLDIEEELEEAINNQNVIF